MLQSSIARIQHFLSFLTPNIEINVCFCYNQEMNAFLRSLRIIIIIIKMLKRLIFMTSQEQYIGCIMLNRCIYPIVSV